MSATSEQLAAQAEELQASITFFKVDMAGARKPAVQKAPARVPKLNASRVRKAPQDVSGRSQSVPAQQARAKGFALDMSMGGPDEGDADSRRTLLKRFAGTETAAGRHQAARGSQAPNACRRWRRDRSMSDCREVNAVALPLFRLDQFQARRLGNGAPHSIDFRSSTGMGHAFDH